MQLAACFNQHITHTKQTLPLERLQAPGSLCEDQVIDLSVEIDLEASDVQAQPNGMTSKGSEANSQMLSKFGQDTCLGTVRACFPFLSCPYVPVDAARCCCLTRCKRHTHTHSHTPPLAHTQSLSVTKLTLSQRKAALASTEDQCNTLRNSINVAAQDQIENGKSFKTDGGFLTK